MQPLRDMGIDTSNFDGYRVTYSYTLMDDLKPSDIQLIIMGFHDDLYGYFGMGVLGDPVEANKYFSHGVGYWNWPNGMEWSEIKSELVMCLVGESKTMEECWMYVSGIDTSDLATPKDQMYEWLAMSN